MHPHFNVPTVLTLHKSAILEWKVSDVTFKNQDIYKLVEENHAFNYQLWHAEDKARRDDMGAEFVYKAKRAIDGFNQQRNNRMEAMDEWFFNALKPTQEPTCPVHSESPGMIIDRLSILALKAYHMEEQTRREDASEAHKKTCANKLGVIHQQLNQLSLCLEQLLVEIQSQKRTFKVYHQFKMYNDPALNPELYLN